MKNRHSRLIALFCIELIIFLPVCFVSALTIQRDPNPAKDITENSVTIEWFSDVPATSKVDYGTTKNLGQTEESFDFVTDHAVSLANLQPLTRYYYQIMSVDEQGDFVIDNNNGIFYSFETERNPDLYPPELTDIQLVSLTPTTATIRWTTDEPSTTVVAYGTTPQMDELYESDIMTVTHIATVPAQDGVKTYYRVKSCDDSNNCEQGDPESFVGGADTTPPEINVEIPPYHNSNRLDILGTTEPYATVTIYVNDVKSRILSKYQTGEQGIINTRGVLLTQDVNNIKLEAEDQVGNKAEQEYTVEVDGLPPVVSVDNITSATSDQTVTISGNVDEDVNLKIKIISDLTPPDRPHDLEAGLVTSDSVELEWQHDNESDVSEYAVYRDDVRVGSSTTLSFTDRNLGSGEDYRYTVSAVDEKCNEGEKSPPVIATTASGNAVEDVILEDAELTCEAEDPGIQVPAGEFSQTVQLDEGSNTIKIIAADKAGNEVIIERDVNYDPYPPNIINNNLDALAITYIDEVTITGTVDEPAEVIVTINDKDIYRTVTEPDGTFAVPVELSRSSSLEVDVSDTGAVTVQYGHPTGWQNTVSIVAVDFSGTRSQEKTGTILVTLCGGTEWYDLQIAGVSGMDAWGAGSISPPALTPRLMLEGTQVITFPVNLSYKGPGTGTITDNPSVTVSLPNLQLADEYDEEWVGAIQPIWRRKSGGATGAIRIPIKKLDDLIEWPSDDMTMLEKENNISDHRKNQCQRAELDAGVGCVRIPLLMEIEFEQEKTIPYTGTPGQGPATETTVERLRQLYCWDLEIVIDRRIPPDYIPENALEFWISFFNDSIEIIDDVLGPLRQLTENVMYLCLGSWALNLVMSLSVNFKCKYSKWVGAIKKLGGEDDDGYFDPTVAEIGACAFYYTPDSESFSNCESCEAAFFKKDAIQKFMRNTCDKISCPSAPTFQKYIRDNKNRKLVAVNVKKVNQNEKTVLYKGSSCATDYIKDAIPDKDFVQQQYAYYKNPAYQKNYNAEANPTHDQRDTKTRTLSEQATMEFTPSDSTACRGLHPAFPECCGYEYMDQWGSSCGIGESFMYDELEQSLCLAYQEENSTLGYIPDTGISGLTLSCGNIGNFGGGFCDPKEADHFDFVNGGTTFKQWSSFSPTPKDKPPGVFFEVRLLGENLAEPGDEAPKIAQNYDITMCYVVDTYEAKGQEDSEVDEEASFTINQKIDCVVPATGKDHWKNVANNMEKSKFLSTYGGEIENAEVAYERLLASIGTPDQEYIIDPKASIFTSIRCACLGAVFSFLQLWRNIFSLIMNCMQTVLVTGDGSPGTCQSLVSVYICDFVFEAISCLAKRFGASGGRGDVGGGFSRFTSSITGAINDVQSDVTGRYGDTDFFASIFAKDRLQHAICLFMFFGEWDFDLEDLVEDSIQPPPVESQGFFPTCERIFTGFNPATNPDGLASWSYDMSLALVAGSDLRYGMELICTSGYECDPAEGFENGRCDCWQVGDQKINVVASELGDGTLSQGETIDTNVFYTLSDSKYRYNRARLWWEWTDDENQAHSGEVFCNIDQSIAPPAFCSFDAGSLAFRCSLGMGSEDWIRINEIEPAYDEGLGSFKLGDQVSFNINLLNKFPDPPPEDGGATMHSYTKFLIYDIVSHDGSPVASNRDDSFAVVKLNELGQIKREIDVDVRVKEDHFIVKSATPRVEVSPDTQNDLYTLFSLAGSDILVNPPADSTTVQAFDDMILFKENGEVKFKNFDRALVDSPDDMQDDPDLELKDFSQKSHLVYSSKSGGYTVKVQRKPGNGWPPTGSWIYISQSAQELGDICETYKSTPAQWEAQFEIHPAKETGGTFLVADELAIDAQGNQQKITIPFNVTCTEKLVVSAPCTANSQVTAKCACGDSECNPGYYCYNDQCIPPCSFLYDLAKGCVCNFATGCTCGGDSTKSTTNCSLGQSCLNNVCTNTGMTVTPVGAASTGDATDPIINYFKANFTESTTIKLSIDLSSTKTYKIDPEFDYVFSLKATDETGLSGLKLELAELALPNSQENWVTQKTESVPAGTKTHELVSNPYRPDRNLDGFKLRTSATDTAGNQIQNIYTFKVQMAVGPSDILQEI